MQTVRRMTLSTVTALLAVGVVLVLTFAFVLAPLLAGGGFVLALLAYQVIRRRIGPRG